MFVRFLFCMLRPSPSYSFLSQHASYWKVKSIFLGREKRHFAWSFDAVYSVKWPISHDVLLVADEEKYNINRMIPMQ